MRQRIGHQRHTTFPRQDVLSWRLPAVFPWTAAVMLLVGCGGDPDALEEMTPESTLESQGSAGQERLLEPFDPPPLDDLLGSATWIDRRMVDLEGRCKRIKTGTVAHLDRCAAVIDLVD